MCTGKHTHEGAVLYDNAASACIGGAIDLLWCCVRSVREAKEVSAGILLEVVEGTVGNGEVEDGSCRSAIHADECRVGAVVCLNDTVVDSKVGEGPVGLAAAEKAALDLAEDAILEDDVAIEEIDFLSAAILSLPSRLVVVERSIRIGIEADGGSCGVLTIEIEELHGQRSLCGDAGLVL